MAVAACDGEESSLFERNQGQQGSKHTMTTTFRHPPFPNLTPKMERICYSHSTKVECVYGYSKSSNIVIQQAVTQHCFHHLLHKFSTAI